MELLEAAERLERLPDLGRAIRSAVAAMVPHLPADALVFVNLHPADLNDPRTLERLARECLGMVRPGQIAFVTIPKHAAPIPPDCG